MTTEPDGAKAYCKWLTVAQASSLQVAQPPSAVRLGDVRLPDEWEWERAARGADARYFPWGNYFDWRFCKGAKSRPKDAQPEEIGVIGLDESSFGMRDAEGSIAEWCWNEPEFLKGTRAVRGGAWSSAAPLLFRAAYRYALALTFVLANVGSRLVRVAGR